MGGSSLISWFDCSLQSLQRMFLADFCPPNPSVDGFQLKVPISLLSPGLIFPFDCRPIAADWEKNLFLAPATAPTSLATVKLCKKVGKLIQKIARSRIEARIRKGAFNDDHSGQCHCPAWETPWSKVAENCDNMKLYGYGNNANDCVPKIVKTKQILGFGKCALARKGKIALGWLEV